MDFLGTQASRAQFEANMDAKMRDDVFLTDLEPLLRPALKFDTHEAWQQVHKQIVSRLLVPRIFNYYTKSGSPCVSSVRWAKRAIDSRIWSADLVHLNGFGSSLWASR